MYRHAMKRRLRSATRFRTAPPRRMAGLSLIELMISITIGLMILSGVAFVFVNTSSARNEVERTSRQIENGRYAVEVIAEDLRLAGFYGELNLGSMTPAGMLSSDPLPDNQCSLDPTKWKLWMPLHVQGYDNGAGFDKVTTAACALADQKTNTDILLIRRARTCLSASPAIPVASGGCNDTPQNNKPYVQVSLCAEDVTNTHKLGLEGTETFDLKKKACGTTVADKRQYLVYIYYISTNNGSGVNVPTLKRLELTGTGWTTTALVEGIEEFNVLYGLDTDGNGSPDSYSASPAATTAAWMSVVSVQLHILARSLETSPGYTDSKTYTLGVDAANSPLTFSPSDGYRRHVYTSLVRLNNPAGRKDLP
jgi:type IV pilus assembly protein PilW